jgi:hypothetical protein
LSCTRNKGKEGELNWVRLSLVNLESLKKVLLILRLVSPQTTTPEFESGYYSGILFWSDVNERNTSILDIDTKHKSSKNYLEGLTADRRSQAGTKT